jgi:mannose/fructose-specific phosphotransferase system component IIA
MLGGTGFNVANELFNADNELIIAGVNLPMLLKASEVRQGSPAEVAANLVDRSRRAVDCRFPPSRRK